MDMYFQERLEHCLQMESMNAFPFGVLNVRVYFNHECVFVEVLKARDVIPLDSNGMLVTELTFFVVCIN